MLNTDAWKQLSGNAVKVLVELCQLNNGSNNGGIFLSAREAAFRCRQSINTSAKCLQELVDTGFVDIVEKGAFSRKTKTATTYRLTWLPVGNEVTAQSGLQRAPTHSYKTKAK
jgi:hypothetical protein